MKNFSLKLKNINYEKIVLLTIVIFLSSCGSGGNGELIGVQDRKVWNPTDPYGMVYIPQGSFNDGTI